MDHSTTVSTPVATKTRPSSFTRVVATVLTAALAAGGLTVIAAAAPASASVTDTVNGGSFSWNVSKYSVTGLNTRAASGDATLASDGVITWTKGSGSVNTTTGESDISYSGSAKLSFVNNGAEFYSITLANPEVEVDATGAGKLIADVSYAVGSTTAATADVVLTRFQTGDTASDVWTAGTASASLSDTPFWDNTILPGSADATALGITDPELPYSGQSFSKEFLTALPSSLRAHFYASKTSGAPNVNNPNKFPSTFAATATFATPVVTPTVASQTFAGGYVVNLAGDGFRPSTNPGDSGVYVGIAPAGGHPGFQSADIAKFVVADWVNAGAIVNGTFTRTLTAPSAKLDPSVDYSIYTWQAHTHSNTTQDTETPLDIDFDALERYTSSVTATAPATVTFGSTPQISAAVSDGDVPATGSVEFFNGATSVGSADLVDGGASLEVPNLAVGTYSFTAKYSGDDHYAASTSAVAPVTVERAQAGSVTVKLTRTSAVYGTAVNAMATVVGGTGSVAINVDDKQVGTATLTTAGVATVRLPASLLVGAHSITASYAGSETVGPKDSAPITLRIVKASTAKVTVSGAKYKKNTAPSVTVKVAKLNNGGWAHGTVKVYVGSKVVKTVKITTANKGTITVKLPKQTKSSIPVKAAYSGTTTINAKNSATVRIKRK